MDIQLRSGSRTGEFYALRNGSNGRYLWAQWSRLPGWCYFHWEPNPQRVASRQAQAQQRLGALTEYCQRTLVAILTRNPDSWWRQDQQRQLEEIISSPPQLVLVSWRLEVQETPV